MYIYLHIYRHIFYLFPILNTHTYTQMANSLPVMRKTRVWSLDQEDPLEKEMATHSSILAWKIPWTEEPGGLQSMELQRVAYDWANNADWWYTYRFSPHRKKFLLLNCCLNGSAVRKKIKEDNDTPPESVLLICSSIFAINTAINVTAHMEWTYIPFQRTVSKTKHI